MSANPKDIEREQLVSVKINGKTFFGSLDETILDVTKRNNISIPHLCYLQIMQ